MEEKVNTPDICIKDGISITSDTPRGWNIPCCTAGFKESFKDLLQMAWPIICIQVLQLALSPIALMFCGHLGDPIKFDGAALAISVINCTVISVGHGMSTACDTVFAQTILSRNKTLVGVYIQKAVLLFSLCLVFFCAILVNLEVILLYLGQHPEASKIAAEYVLIFIPGALCFYNYLIFSKYLLSMDILYPNIVISIFTNILNAIMHYVFLYVFDLGIRGSAISLTISHILNLVLVLCYIVISKCYKETWKGWTMECLEEWMPMVRLSLSGMLMIAMEWWAFELGLLLSGLLGTIELGSMSIILQMDQMWYQVPLAVEIAGSIRVGQRLGVGDIKGAKIVGWLAIALTACLAVVPIVFFVGIPRYFTSVFTNIPEIVDLTAKLLPLVALYVVFDGIGCACKGVLTGTGRQNVTAILIFVSYYIVGLPIGIPLMFLTHLRVAGYWVGLSVNMLFQAIILLIIIPCTDWQKQMKMAFERNKTSNTLDEEQTGLTRAKSENVLRKGSLHEAHMEIHARFNRRRSVYSTETIVLNSYMRTGRSKTYRIIQYTSIIAIVVVLAVGVLLRILLPIPIDMTMPEHP